MIGTHLTPVIGLDLALRYHNKYGIETIRTGFRYKTYVFAQKDSSDYIRDFGVGISMGAFFMGNISPGAKHPVFMGLEGGFINMSVWSPYADRPNGKNYYFQMLSEYKGIQDSAGLVQFGSSVTPMVGVKLPF